MAIWSFSLSQIIEIEVPQFEIFTESERNSITGTIEKNEYFMKLLYVNFTDDCDLTNLKKHMYIPK